VSPYARRGGEGRSGDRDVIERARIAIAASVSATSKASHRADGASTDGVVGLRLPQHRMPPLPSPPQPRENFVVHGMRHVVAGTAAAAASSRRPPASMSSRASGVTNSSVEPDSDAAVVGSVVPEHHQHTRDSYEGFENADRQLSFPSEDEAATTPRTRPAGNAPGPGAAPESFGASSKFLSSPLPNPSSREDEDYDTWLDSALATQTFDEPNRGEGGERAERNVGRGPKSAHDPRKHSLLLDDDDDDDDDSEPLRDWLDSVLP
jgi:hypothetical protein